MNCILITDSSWWVMNRWQISHKLIKHELSFSGSRQITNGLILHLNGFPELQEHISSRLHHLCLASFTDNKIIYNIYIAHYHWNNSKRRINVQKARHRSFFILCCAYCATLYCLHTGIVMVVHIQSFVCDSLRTISNEETALQEFIEVLKNSFQNS